MVNYGIEIKSNRTNGGYMLQNMTIENARWYGEVAVTVGEETYTTFSNISINNSNGYVMRITISLDCDTDQYDFSNYLLLLI